MNNQNKFTLIIFFIVCFILGLCAALIIGLRDIRQTIATKNTANIIYNHNPELYKPSIKPGEYYEHRFFYPGKDWYKKFQVTVSQDSDWVVVKIINDTAFEQIEFTF